MKILCIDIGNTSTQFGVLEDGVVLFSERVNTHENAFCHAIENALALPFEAVAYASVVPLVNAQLELSLQKTGLLLFQLTHEQCVGLTINYPRPEEVGQDRLASCIGAQKYYVSPTLVIDLGTAITLDFVTDGNVYTPGAIAPGLSIMTDYFNEKTALLPRLFPQDLLYVPDSVTSTEDAMAIGCMIGFSGLIKALIEHALKSQPSGMKVVATGGSLKVIPKSWSIDIDYDPDLTLKGLEEAYLRFY